MKAPERKIPRSIYEGARDAARALADTEAFEQSRRDRKRVEMLFAHFKRILRLGRLRLRGPRGAQDSSRSPQSRRTYDGSLNWSPDHHQHPPLRVQRNRCGRQATASKQAPNGAYGNENLKKSRQPLHCHDRRFLRQNLPVKDPPSIGEEGLQSAGARCMV